MRGIGGNHIKLLLCVLICLTLWILLTLHRRIQVSMEMNDSMVDHSMHNHHEHMHHDMTTADPHAHHNHHNHDMSGTADNGGDPHAGHDMGADHMMMMYFHASVEATILFKGWATSNWQGMLVSCILVYIMGVLYEGLKVLREVLLQRSILPSAKQLSQVPTSEEAVIIARSPAASMCSIPHVIQSILHILQVVVSYFLMLIFMTYNVYLCIAVALGAGTGYFLFAWRRTSVVDLNEHCH